MSDFFYDGQMRRYITQFIRLMSNFSYQDGRGNIVQVPARYGDMSRQVGSLLKKNSENTVPSAPFISCYIKDLKFDQKRLQQPDFVSKINIRERDTETDPITGQVRYLNTQGANYTIERIMPSPYMVTFAADIWTTNTEQKFQIWEQIAVLFNPSLDLQTTDNYLDWTSLSVLTLTEQGAWSSRQIPQGIEQDIDILNMVFTAPVWITPPAKVKQLGIITKIITNVFTLPEGTIESEYMNLDAVDAFGTPATTVVVTPGNFDLLVLNNVASLVINEENVGTDLDLNDPRNVSSWYKVLDLYPGKFTAGLSQLRLTTPAGNEIVAFMRLDPTNDARMMLTFDQDTVPGNTVIDGRGTVDAIINPETFVPNNVATGTRYLILENIPTDTAAWGSFAAAANDIIQWNGSAWTVIFDSTAVTSVTYITNAYTSVQYKWDGFSWSKSFEGIYDKATWRLIL